MACGNVRREAYTAGSEAALSSLEIDNVGAFSVQTLGAAPEAPPRARRAGPAGVQERGQSCRMARQGTWEVLSCPRGNSRNGMPGYNKAPALATRLHCGGALRRTRIDRQAW